MKMQKQMKGVTREATLVNSEQKTVIKIIFSI